MTIEGHSFGDGGPAWPHVKIYDAPFWSNEVLRPGDPRLDPYNSPFVDRPGEGSAFGLEAWASPDEEIQVIDGLGLVGFAESGTGLPPGCQVIGDSTRAGCMLITDARAREACIAGANASALACKTAFCSSHRTSSYCRSPRDTSEPPKAEWSDTTKTVLTVGGVGAGLLFLWYVLK